MLADTRTLTWVALGTLTMSILGCAPGQRMQQIKELERRLAERDQEVQVLQSDIQKGNQRLASLRNAKQDCEAQRPVGMVQQPAAPVAVAHSNAMTALPPARPGECYARVFVPATYDTVSETVLKQDATERLEVTPSQYEWAEQQVVIKDAATRLEEVPAEYKWVEEQVLVHQATTQYEPVEATYRTVSEQVLVTPAHTEWKKGRGPIEKVDDATGEIMCLLEVPAVYETMTKRVVDTPAVVKEVTLPAKYETVRKQVLVRPATVKKINIPAEYQTVKVKRLVSPAKTNRIAVPAEYETITKQIKKSEGRLEWRRVLCETNSTPEMLSRIERALDQAGHNPGAVDGVLDSDAYAAIRSFQKTHDLNVGGLTHQTLERLGISFD